MVEGMPEKNKKPGLSYAWTDDGIELPVIDITHRAPSRTTLQKSYPASSTKPSRTTSHEKDAPRGACAQRPSIPS